MVQGSGLGVRVQGSGVLRTWPTRQFRHSTAAPPHPALNFLPPPPAPPPCTRRPAGRRRCSLTPGERPASEGIHREAARTNTGVSRTRTPVWSDEVHPERTVEHRGEDPEDEDDMYAYGNNPVVPIVEAHRPAGVTRN